MVGLFRSQAGQRWPRNDTDDCASLENAIDREIIATRTRKGEWERRTTA